MNKRVQGLKRLGEEQSREIIDMVWLNVFRNNPRNRSGRTLYGFCSSFGSCAEKDVYVEINYRIGVNGERK